MWCVFSCNVQKAQQTDATIMTQILMQQSYEPYEISGTKCNQKKKSPDCMHAEIPLHCRCISYQ